MKKEIVKAKNWVIDPAIAPAEAEKILDQIIDLISRFSSEEIRSFILSTIQACMGPDDYIKSIKIKGQHDDGSDYTITIVQPK
jgi:hypothetical protein